MPRISLSRAARMAGFTKQHLHRAYIKTGKLVHIQDDDKRIWIDVDDLRRVFPNLTGDDGGASKYDGETTDEIDRLRDKVDMLQALLNASERINQEKERLLSERAQRIEELNRTIALLEHRPARESVAVIPTEPRPEPEPEPTPEAAATPSLTETITAEPTKKKRGFFSWILGR